MQLKAVSALLAGVLLVACATPYKEHGLGGGYTDEKIDETHYRVKFSGNGYASSDRVWAFWMYRCAELTKQKGYTHFSLHKPGDPLVRLNREEPARQGFRAAVYHQGEGGGAGLLKTGGSAPIIIFTPGTRITTYHSDAVVALHRSPLADGVYLLKAQTVLDELSPYVKSNGETDLIKRDDLLDKALTYIRPQIGYGFGGEL